MVVFRVAYGEEICLLSVFSSPIHCLVGRVLVIDRNSSISLRNTFNINEHSHLGMTRTYNTNNVVRTTRTRPLSGKSYSVSRSNYSVLLYKTVPKAVDLAHTDVLDVISVTKKRHFCKNMSAFCFILCWRVEGGREGQEHGGKGAGSG